VPQKLLHAEYGRISIGATNGLQYRCVKSGLNLI
jgi:hypothetical protein